MNNQTSSITDQDMEKESSFHKRIELGEAVKQAADHLKLSFRLAFRDHKNEERTDFLSVPFCDH